MLFDTRMFYSPSFWMGLAWARITGKLQSNNNLKYMDLREFVELGYLQEANRQFFHPLGLALVYWEDDKTPDHMNGFLGIWDERHDPEGIYFEFDMNSKEVRDKTKHVASCRKAMAKTRLKWLGFDIQPVGR